MVTAIPDSITCRKNVCKTLYHSRCAGFSRANLATVIKLPNLFWFCNSYCKSSQPCPISYANNVSIQLMGIQDSLTKLADAIAKTPEWPSVSAPFNSGKRRRVIDSEVSLNAEKPTKSQSAAFVIGSADSDEVLQIFEPRKLLVASMLHPSTESDHFATFLKQKLDIPLDSTAVRIHKLVPDNTNLSTLDYVSFKVGVPGHRFDELMSPSMWPKHCGFFATAEDWCHRDISSRRSYGRFRYFFHPQKR